MTDAALADSSDSKKSGKKPLIIGALLALLGGAGGFYATSQGLVLPPESTKTTTPKPEIVNNFKDISFVPLEPLTISMPRSSRYNHLRFRGELEVSQPYEDDVKKIIPRVIDVLNSYLRALEISDIENAASLAQLRSQMLRRVQTIAGPGKINDLLIMEFVLN